jgi:hypothetical protein
MKLKVARLKLLLFNEALRCDGRWIFNTIIEFLEIIHRPVFHLKHNVSETEFCLLFQVKAYS